MGGPDDPRPFDHRDRDAVVLARRAAHLRAADQALLAARRGSARPVLAGSGCLSRTHGHADLCAWSAGRRPAYTHHPHVDGRGARQGLRAHRDRRGRAEGRRRGAQRLPQRAHHADHNVGHENRLPARRRHRHRSHVRAPRHNPRIRTGGDAVRTKRSRQGGGDQPQGQVQPLQQDDVGIEDLVHRDPAARRRGGVRSGDHAVQPDGDHRKLSGPDGRPPVRHRQPWP